MLDLARQRFGVMGSDYPSRKRDIGQILAICMGSRVRKIGRPDERIAALSFRQALGVDFRSMVR